MGSELEINELYKPLYTSDKRYFVLTGGRGSLKSHSVADFVLRLTFEQGQGVFFTRLTMKSAETSIIPEFDKAIDRLKVRDHFNVNKKDISNLTTSSYIWFRGLKSSSEEITANQKSLSGITTWIIEEAEDLIDEELFNKIDDSIRTTGKQNRIILILNPTTREHWIYKKWFEHTNKKIKIDGFNVSVSNHPKMEHIHSTYLIGQKYLSKDWLDKAYRYRKMAKNAVDPDTGRKLTDEEHKQAIKHYVNNYLGGWLEKREGAVFNDWSEGHFDDSLPYIYGQDYGFAVEGDPTTLVKIAIDKRKNRIYCKEELYLNNMDTDAIVKANKSIAKGKLIVADSAEPRLISDLKKKGCNIVKCVKGQGSVTAGIKLLQGFELIIDPNSSNLKKELNNYIWNDKKSGVPVDDWNHIIDAIRYAVGHLLQRNSHPGFAQN